MRVISAATTFLIVLTLSACGSSGVLTGSVESTRTSSPARSSVCADLLSQTQARRATRVDLDEPKVKSDVGVRGCQWLASRGHGVLFAAVIPSERWLEALPDSLDALAKGPLGKTPAAKAGLARLRAMLRSGDHADGNGGCELFTKMLGLQYPALPTPSNYVIVFAPDPAHPVLVTGQACYRGKFRSVVWQAPGIKANKATQDRFKRALFALDDSVAASQQL